MKVKTKNCYVNLPLRYIYNTPEYLDLFIENSIQPELGLDCLGSECLSKDWLYLIKDRLAAAGLKCTTHLPFLDLKLSSLNPAIRKASVDTLCGAFELAKIFSPERMIIHPSFTSWLEPPLFQEAYEYCLESIRILSDSWSDHPMLCLENTYEYNPGPLLQLVEDLDRENVGICFDVGHWHSFSKGSEKNDFDLWFDSLAPYIRHMHFHDNKGRKDEHLALGEGNINWEHIISRVKELNPLPSITLEPHTRDDFESSLKYFKEKIEPILF